MLLSDFILCRDRLPETRQYLDRPWLLVDRIQEWLPSLAEIHSSARIALSVVIEGPVYIGPGCRIGPGSVLREGVWLDENLSIGPNCEVKASVIFQHSAIAHFNYVGNSVIGQDVNLEAGVVLANHWNERVGESVTVRIDQQRIDTTLMKFGALIGDGTRIGANAVTSPGTILRPGTLVPRLRLIDQSTDTQ
jgi:NDP-sugar pyrophosphorylase family protein